MSKKFGKNEVEETALGKVDLNEEKSFDETLNEIREKDQVEQREEENGYNPFNNYNSEVGGEEMTESSTKRYLRDNDVFELIVGVDKDDLINFVQNNFKLPKKLGYRNVSQMELMDLLGNKIDKVDWANARKTYFPSSNSSNLRKMGVKSVISILISDEVMPRANKPVNNVVDLTRRETSFEVSELLNNLDTSAIFSPSIAIPHRRYENSGIIELFANTTVTLLAFLGLTLEDIGGKYNFTVQEVDDKFIVQFQKY